MGQLESSYLSTNGTALFSSVIEIADIFINQLGTSSNEISTNLKVGKEGLSNTVSVQVSKTIGDYSIIIDISQDCRQALLALGADSINY